MKDAERIAVCTTARKQDFDVPFQWPCEPRPVGILSISTPGLISDSTPDGAVGRRTNLWWVAVLFLTVLSLALRLVAIDHDSLWLDEAVTAGFTRVSALDFITGRVYDLGNPPFYWIVAGLWSMVFGISEVGLRSFPVFTGALMVPFLALTGRRLLSPRVGLWAALLLAISPTAIELSNEARPYSLLGLLAVVATWLFVRWVQENRRLDLALYSIVVFLGCFTHYYGGAVPLAHAAALAALPRDRRRLGSWLGAIAVAGILGLSILNILVAQLGTQGNLSRMGERWVFQFLATPMVFGFGRSLAWRDAPAWALGAVTLAAVVCFWLPALFALSRWPRNRFAAVLLGFWAFIPIVIPLLVALTWSPFYATRYAFVGIPSFLLLSGWGLVQLRPAYRGAVLVSILLLTAMSSYCYATRSLKDDWRSETRFVLERLKPGELVAIQPGHEVMTFLYYLPRYGTAPPEMVSLQSGPDREGRLPAVKYQNGVRADRLPRDCTPAVSSSAGVWLIVCGSSEPARRFRDYFVGNGLKLVEQRRSGRMEIDHFARDIRPSRGGADAQR
jgi:hypothetical protein